MEQKHLASVGWDDEGLAWRIAPKATKDVYRLYNPKSGEHFYTTSAIERDSIVESGWDYEGVAWKTL